MCMTPDEEVKMIEILEESTEVANKITQSYERMEKQLDLFQEEIDRKINDMVKRIKEIIEKND